MFFSPAYLWIVYLRVNIELLNWAQPHCSYWICEKRVGSSLNWNTCVIFLIHWVDLFFLSSLEPSGSQRVLKYQLCSYIQGLGILNIYKISRFFGPKVTSHKCWMFLLKSYPQGKCTRPILILNVKLKRISVFYTWLGFGHVQKEFTHLSPEQAAACFRCFQLSVLYSFVSLLIIVPRLLTATGIILLTCGLAGHSAGFYIRLTYLHWAHFQSVKKKKPTTFSTLLHLFNPCYQATASRGVDESFHQFDLKSFK